LRRSSKLSKESRRRCEIKAYDIDKVAEAIGLDRDTIIMLLGEFKTVMDEEIENLKKAVDSDDAEQITQVAHKMKGASANMMAEDIRSYCAVLQTADKNDKELVGSLYENILRSVQEFRELI